MKKALIGGFKLLKSGNRKSVLPMQNYTCQFKIKCYQTTMLNKSRKVEIVIRIKIRFIVWTQVMLLLAITTNYIIQYIQLGELHSITRH